uniref:Uncharacterized protein n=1 Tax=Physcomitrium patens TaxID=3218 RepID=A0A2K1ITH0_PHYPA|nr:hypothetical protein PHYPA_024519 [Physcomitrium patens]
MIDIIFGQSCGYWYPLVALYWSTLVCSPDYSEPCQIFLVALVCINNGEYKFQYDHELFQPQGTLLLQLVWSCQMFPKVV